MRRLFIALMGVMLCAVSARAQSAHEPRPVQFSPVTVVRITGTVSSVPEGNPPLPFEVLAAVERDPYMTGLRTQPQPNAGPHLDLTYSFPTVQAYREWTETAQTRQLLDTLRRRVQQFDLTVSLIRSQHTLILPDR